MTITISRQAYDELLYQETVERLQHPDTDDLYSVNISAETIHSKSDFAATNRITASGFLSATAAETKTFVSITTLIRRDDTPQFLRLFPLRLKSSPLFNH